MLVVRYGRRSVLIFSAETLYAWVGTNATGTELVSINITTGARINTFASYPTVRSRLFSLNSNRSAFLRFKAHTRPLVERQRRLRHD